MNLGLNASYLTILMHSSFTQSLAHSQCNLIGCFILSLLYFYSSNRGHLFTVHAPYLDIELLSFCSITHRLHATTLCGSYDKDEMEEGCYSRTFIYFTENIVLFLTIAYTSNEIFIQCQQRLWQEAAWN